MMSTVQCINEPKSMKKELIKLLMRERRARCLAEAANKQKDDYIAEISHELRAPINAILCGVTLLQSKKADNETIDQVIQIIARSAQTQLHFVEDLLDQRRIISGKVQLNLQPVNLTSLARATQELLRWDAERKSIRLSFCCDEPELMVMADPERLQQVFCNLISNAIKFTPAGGEIEIKVERNLSRAQVKVKDSGEGISPQALARIFEGFFQANRSIGQRSSGLGLGLWIAQRLVELHKGSIHAESEGHGAGAVFMVDLPRLIAN